MGLDTVELVLQIEDEYGISISIEEASEILTVGDLVILIEKHTGDIGQPILFEAIFERVVSFLVEDYDVKKELITPSSEIVKDLGLD